jgi:sporulation protein YlmC with PRC-barrel domain
MLRSASKIIGYRLNGVDGEVGRAVDFLLDDTVWEVRYLVVETGPWLDGRRVLISPSALCKGEWTSRRLVLDATREKIESAPSLEGDGPVSREHELELSRHYGWDVGGFSLLGDSAEVPPPAVVPPVREEPALRSLKELLGQALAAEDGGVGHVEDLIVDDDDWACHHLVVGSKNWLSGRKILVPVEWIKKVNWADHQVEVERSASSLESEPEFNPLAPVYERSIYERQPQPLVDGLAQLPADNDVPTGSRRFGASAGWSNPVSWGTRGLKAAIARIIHG